MKKLLFAGVFLAWPAASWAAGTDDAGLELKQVQEKIDTFESRQGLLEKGFGQPTAEALAVRVQRRMTDAQILFIDGHYMQASIIYFDVLKTPGIESNPAYMDALYYLGESLFQSNNNFAARTYFKNILNNEHPVYMAKAAVRLVEIAFRLKDYKAVDDYFARLRSASSVKIDPSILYIRAKSLYNRGELEGAKAAFAEVPAGSEFYFQSQYFMGMILVRQEKSAEGIAVFQNLGREEGRTEGEKKIVQLSHMALGRILYETGKFDEAVAEYQKIPPNSEYFDDYLFEVTWTLVKMGSFEKAIRSLDILLLATSDITFIPEAEVLKGNLFLKMENYDKAVGAFEEIVSTYKPIDDELKKIEETQSVDDLIEKMGGEEYEIDISAVMPSVALKWASAEKDVKDALAVTQDMNESRAFIQDVDRILDKMLTLVPDEAGGQYEVFPMLREAKKGLVEIENGVLGVRDDLAEIENSIVQAGVTGDEAREMEKAREERANIEKAFQNLPKTKEQIDERDMKFTSEMITLEKEIFKSGSRIDSMKAQIDGIQKWYNDMNPALKGDPEVKARFEQKMFQEKRVMSRLIEDLKNLQNEVSTERVRMGGLLSKEDEMRMKYNSILDRERELTRQARSKLSPELLAVLDKVETTRDKVEGLGREAEEANKRLLKIAATKANEIRGEVLKEKKNVEEYKKTIRDIENETRHVAANVALDSIRNVRTRFKKLILDADVGILDVVWKRKQLQSEEIRSVADRQAVEEGKLDGDFKDVIKKDEEKETKR